MPNANFFDDIAKQLCKAIPESVRKIEADLQCKFKEILQSAFAKLDLVTREEFDTQSNVLARSRAKLDAMEKQIKAIEEQVIGKAKPAHKK